MAATANTISPALPFCGAFYPPSSLSSPTRLIVHFPPLRKHPPFSSSASCSSLRLKRCHRTKRLRSFVVAAAAANVGETLVPKGEAESIAPHQPEGDKASPTAAPDQPVFIPVSPSDVLTMFFQAECSINETSIPTVSKALEETKGISDIRVEVVEGIATVQLTKQTTVQRLELIQSKGFKLQTLNLSFRGSN